MNNFTYSSATDTNSALKLFSESPDRNARFLAGGTNLVDLMREGIEQPLNCLRCESTCFSGCEAS
jgi:xanthine dehydrogenase YagS FAD-binding subunit